MTAVKPSIQLKSVTKKTHTHTPINTQCKINVYTVSCASYGFKRLDIIYEQRTHSRTLKEIHYGGTQWPPIFYRRNHILIKKQPSE